MIEDTSKDRIIEKSSTNANGKPTEGEKEKNEIVDDVLFTESPTTQPKLMIDKGSSVVNEANGKANTQEVNIPEFPIDEVSASQGETSEPIDLIDRP